MACSTAADVSVAFGNAGVSERDAKAASGSPDAALVGHCDAFHRTEQRDIPGSVIGAKHRAHRAALAGRRERKPLPDQGGIDGGIAAWNGVGPTASFPSPDSFVYAPIAQLPIAHEIRVL